MPFIAQKPRQLFITIGAAIGWFAVLFQLYLILSNRTASIGETVIRFFSFFTILTNILVALSFTFLLLRPGSKPGIFFASPATATALTVYIAVVGIIYNVVLRFLWSPRGLQLVVDELLHSVIPVVFIVYWLLFVPKRTLQWRYVLPWLVYPAAYCVYTLIRGAVVGFYPYPFMNVTVLGYKTVLVNVTGMVTVFLVLSLVLVGIGKLIRLTPEKKNTTTAV